MATFTSNYAWTKPAGSDPVDIGVLNNNLDSQDGIIHDAFLNMAVPFSELSTYTVGDIVLYGTKTYRCRVAVTTAGSWTGATNWDEYKLSELTFDNTPTDGSNNPVKSDGIYDSEKDIYAVMGKMGAKNLIPYPYHENTEEDRGITWTNNADGTITITGNATADSAHNLSQRTNTGKLYLPNGKYKLSGCPSGGSDSTYYLEALCTKNSSAKSLGLDNGTGVDITVNGDDHGVDGAYVMVRGIVKNGYAVTNPITFFPMLRLASDTDDTYQPYAKTNRELTDEVLTKIPDAPTTDGAYNLSVTVVNGTPTYSWVSTS